MSEIEEKKKKRFQFLHKLYEVTGGRRYVIENMFEIAQGVAISREEAADIADYLSGEGLIEHRTLGGGIGISHFGILAVEEALSQPDKRTYYFPPVNIISIGTMVGSQIQQASPGAMQVGTIAEDRYGEVEEFIKRLKADFEEIGLDPEQKSDLQAQVGTIEAQMSSPKPNTSILTQCLTSIRNILETAAGTALGGGLLAAVKSLLGG